MTEREISLLIRSLFDLCDRAGRQQIAGMAMAGLMETYPPGERHVELANVMQGFTEMVNYINVTPDWKNPGRSE